MAADLRSVMKKTGMVSGWVSDYSKATTMSTAGKLNLLKKVMKR
jgi:hypothetical protein